MEWLFYLHCLMFPFVFLLFFPRMPRVVTECSPLNCACLLICSALVVRWSVITYALSIFTLHATALTISMLPKRKLTWYVLPLKTKSPFPPRNVESITWLDLIFPLSLRFHIFWDLAFHRRCVYACLIASNQLRCMYTS